MIDRKFPNTRLRRLRKNSNIIDLVSENTLTKNDLIQPIFLKENLNGHEPIESMPEVNRYGLDESLKEIQEIINCGINTIALFPVIDPDKKDDQGSEAIIDNNFVSEVALTSSNAANKGRASTICGMARGLTKEPASMV